MGCRMPQRLDREANGFVRKPAAVRSLLILFAHHGLILSDVSKFLHAFLFDRVWSDMLLHFFIRLHPDLAAQ